MSLEEINQMEPNGSTALHVAAYRGHEKIVELLLQKGACYSTVNKYNCTPLDEAKTDRIKQLIRRRMNTARFVSDASIEWILSTNDADFQASEYWEKLKTYGTDSQFYQLITYIKKNYLEKDLQDIDGINTIKQYFDMAINEKDPVYLLQAYTAETGFYSTLNVHLAQLQLENLTAKENISRAYYIGIIARHPKLKTFSSTSKQKDVALGFLRDNSGTDDRLSTICVYEIRNERTALDIEHISLFQDEKEVLILPYSAFKIIDIKQYENGSPRVEIKLKECEPW
ncbi:unnamed protein product [Rotaria sp. Silwood1]|nr:unnamed protein product [Rotaria sp. Silwood1]